MTVAKKILVTGGAGFLGVWIVRSLLARGLAVRSLDSRPANTDVLEALGIQGQSVDWVTGDIRDSVTVTTALSGCDSLVHSAGIDLPASEDNPLRCFEINASASFRLFDAAISANVDTVVFTSSAAASCSPPTIYGAIKLAVEQSLAALWRRDSLASISIRPFAIYGAGRHGGVSAGLTAACQAVAKGEPFVIPFTGSSWFVPVEAVAEMHAEAVLHGGSKHEIVNAFGAAGTAEGIAEILSSWTFPGAITTAGRPLPQFQDVRLAQIVNSAPALEQGLRQCVDFFAARSGQ